MILIPYQLRPSTISNAGIGLFTLINLDKGEVVWRPTMSDQYSDIEFDRASAADKEFIRHYGYFGKDRVWHIDYDDVRFLNHSRKHSNLTWDDNYKQLVTSKEIIAGSELFQDYAEFELNCRFD